MPSTLSKIICEVECSVRDNLFKSEQNECDVEKNLNLLNYHNFFKKIQIKLAKLDFEQIKFQKKKSLKVKKHKIDYMTIIVRMQR